MSTTQPTEQEGSAFDEQTATTRPPEPFQEPLGVCRWCKVILLPNSAMATRPDGSRRHLGCK